MAIVAPEVPEQPIPNVRLSDGGVDLSTFGGGQTIEAVDRSIQGIAASAGRIAVQEKINADQTAVQDASAKLGEASTRILYDPTTGVLSSRGVNSIPAHDKGYQEFKKTANTISEDLTTPEQKGAFNKYALTLGTEFNRTSMAHASHQMQEHDTQTFNAFVKNTSDFGAMTYGDPLTRERSLKDLDQTATMYAQRNGMDADQTTALKSKITSNYHDQVISRILADKKDMIAKDYFSAYKDQITDADVREKVEKQLEEGSYRGESQRQADAIWGSTKGDLKESLAKVTDIKDPQVRDLTRERIKQYSADDDAAVRQRQDKSYLEAAKMTENVADPLMVRESIPPDMWTQMGPEHQEALLRRNKNEPNDNKAWLDFLDMNVADMGKMNRTDFETKYWSRFDKEHRTRAENQWEQAKKAKDKGAEDPQLSTTLTFNSRIEDTLRASDMIPKNKTRAKLSTAQSDLYDRFETEASREIQNYEITTLGGKRKASGDEQQKIMDQMVIKKVFVDKPWSRDPEKPVGVLTSDERDRVYVPIESIPGPDVTAIENIARSKNRKISKDKVQRAYAAMLVGDRKQFDAVIAE